MKTCSRCNTNKPRSDFYKDIRTRDGLKSECKCCHRSDGAKWREANLDRKRATANAWHKNNPEKSRANATKWRTANPERHRAVVAKWRAANPGKSKASEAKWKANNLDKCRVYGRNRSARKKSAGGKLSPNLASRLLKLQRGRCACCGEQLGNDYHMDHIMPLALGGSNTDDNIQLLSAKCNLQKRSKHPVDFMQQRGFLL